MIRVSGNPRGMPTNETPARAATEQPLCNRSIREQSLRRIGNHHHLTFTITIIKYITFIMLTDFLSVPNILAASVTAAVLLLAHTYCQKGLSKFPGPLLASFTNAWRLRIVWQRNAEKRHIALHKEFGEVVRLGPNFLSFGTPAAIKDIYGLNSHFIKVITTFIFLVSSTKFHLVKVLPHSARNFQW